ncbi:dna-mediated transposase [Trichonephila clavipes]|nr:dna-mediated transposase [Trichonephila clavipes]
MVDEKICSWLAHSSSQNSHVCHSKPSSMNDLEAMETRQIVAENVTQDIRADLSSFRILAYPDPRPLGAHPKHPKDKPALLDISSLHAWIKCFECLLQISYRLDIKKWFLRKEDRPVVNSRKKEVLERFLSQMEILVDAPKPGFRATNDGDTARAFFWNPVIASSTTGIEEILIRKLPVELTTIACGHEIDALSSKNSAWPQLSSI